MKKLLGYVAIICFILGSTGCNKSQKLNCTKTDSSVENLQWKEALNVTFQGKKVTNLSIYAEIEILGTYMNFVSDFETSIKESYANLEGKKGIEFSTNQTDNILSVTITADIKKMDDEAKQALSIGSIYQSLEDAKKELEQEGYTCQ